MHRIPDRSLLKYPPVLTSMWCMKYADGASGFHPPPSFHRVMRQRTAPYFCGTGLSGGGSI